MTDKRKKSYEATRKYLEEVLIRLGEIPHVNGYKATKRYEKIETTTDGTRIVTISFAVQK